MGRVLVADSMPGEISHGHSLAAMIAHYVKRGLIVTSASIAQIPREALAPCARAVADTAARSRRGWLQHVKETARKWSGPAVRASGQVKTGGQTTARSNIEARGNQTTQGIEVSATGNCCDHSCQPA